VARFPLPAANGRCGFGEATFATTRGKGQDAPKADALPQRFDGIRPARFLQIQWVDMSSRFAISDTKYAFENPRTLTLTMPDFSASTGS
jgi:hypothetical protein